VLSQVGRPITPRTKTYPWGPQTKRAEPFDRLRAGSGAPKRWYNSKRLGLRKKVKQSGKAAIKLGRGYKAHVEFEAVAARLKSCPVTKCETERVFPPPANKKQDFRARSFRLSSVERMGDHKARISGTRFIHRGSDTPVLDCYKTRDGTSFFRSLLRPFRAGCQSLVMRGSGVPSHTNR
jgi:hypothetical protein